jgi:hypothetical protein
MKTAMQELIEELRQTRDEGESEYKTAYNLAIAIANQYLEKEKEQILDAVAKGRKQKVENGFWGYTYTPEEIYNQYN